MLNDILKRSDVVKLITEIATNNRYNKKEKIDSINYLKFIAFQQPLFMAVDALFKYKVIIDDIYLLDDFVEQLNLLFKKIDNFHDISNGINRLICKFVIKHLGYKDQKEEKRKEILMYVYDKYITNGYLFHSVSNVYTNDIKINGFTPENYKNLYKEFETIKSVVGQDILEKNFNNLEVNFTDSFLMAYYYAINSPMYFYKLLCDNYLLTKPEDKEAYFKNDYISCFKNLNKVIYKLDLNEEKAKKIRYICNEEWKLLKKSNAIPTVMVIKRNLLLNDNIKDYEEIFNNEEDDLADLIGKIIDSRFNSVSCNKKLEASQIEFIELYSYKDMVKEEKNIKEKIIEEDDNELIDDNGKVSFLLLLGSILITLGIILSIVMMG